MQEGKWLSEEASQIAKKIREEIGKDTPTDCRVSENERGKKALLGELRAPSCDGAGTAERSYPTPEVPAAERSYPRSRSGGAALRRYSSSKVRSGGCALLEQPVKRYPTSKVRETQVRR